MEFINSNLMPDEKVFESASLSEINYKLGFFAFIFGMVFYGLGLFGYFALILGLFGFIFLIKSYLYCEGTELAITSTRILVKTGVLKQSLSSMSWQKMESVSVNQGVIGRYFGFGTVDFFGVGGERITIDTVIDPLGFRKKALARIEPE